MEVELKGFLNADRENMFVFNEESSNYLLKVYTSFALERKTQMTRLLLQRN